ncbi:MAG: NYN domain-containing protein, partial [Bacteroidota bacterium]
KGRHFCGTCSTSTKRYEEKETDVAMAARLLEVLADPDVDVAVVVSGDTDLVPAIRTALKMHLAKPIWSGFPYRRENKELRATATQSFTIRKERYRAYQLPSPVVLGNGRALVAPTGWT